MSMLLDALKKSEEQRQLGKSPDIHDPGDHRPDGGRKTGMGWLAPAMMVAAVAAMAWFGWQQYREPEDLPPPAATDTVSPEPAVASRATPQLPPRATPQLQARPKPAGAGPQALSEARRTPVEDFEATGEPTADEEQPAEPDRRRELSRSIGEFQQPSVAEETAQRAQPERLVTEAATEPPPSARDTPERQEPHVAQPISYWELPQNLRDNLPDFRISVLVYAEEPADRFLLINGQRLVEQDQVEGIVLEEIRRDGAVFRYRNYRFLVKG